MSLTLPLESSLMLLLSSHLSSKVIKIFYHSAKLIRCNRSLKTFLHQNSCHYKYIYENTFIIKFLIRVNWYDSINLLLRRWGLQTNTVVFCCLFCCLFVVVLVVFFVLFGLNLPLVRVAARWLQALEPWTLLFVVVVLALFLNFALCLCKFCSCFFNFALYLCKFCATFGPNLPLVRVDCGSQVATSTWALTSVVGCCCSCYVFEFCVNFVPLLVPICLLCMWQPGGYEPN